MQNKSTENSMNKKEEIEKEAHDVKSNKSNPKICKKKKTNRCQFCDSKKKCKKKLSIVDLSIKCKCGKCFCSVHRPMSNHFCPCLEISATEKKELLMENLGGGAFKQIEVI